MPTKAELSHFWLKLFKTIKMSPRHHRGRVQVTDSKKEHCLPGAVTKVSHQEVEETI